MVQARPAYPRAILIENVTDIATNEDAIILRSIFSKMEELGYSVDCRAYFAFDFGVPQYRQRLFVVGFKNGSRLLEWPLGLSTAQRATLRDAISDLPPLRGGWDEVAPPYGGPVTALQTRLRDGIRDNALFDHVTRDVRQDDLLAFQIMKSKMRYYELPEDLRRYKATSFTDKYNRLAWDEPCRGIAAHIAKDGYWYIHPDQHRSLSIREAARIQSFPDWFRFAGFKTSAFRQIGEAVPPFIGEAIAKKILRFLRAGHGSAKRVKFRSVDKHLAVRKALEDWYKKQSNNAVYPWRREMSLWLNLLGEILFSEKGQRAKTALFWKNYRNDWPQPSCFLKDKYRVDHIRTIGMGDCVPLLEAVARYLAIAKKPSIEALTALGLSERIVRKAFAVSGRSLERPNDVSVIRVARRVFERPAMEQGASIVDDQIATALLVGKDQGATIYAAAIELGETLCSNTDPACMICPVSGYCSHERET
jgi:DNA (cytosine-5)-methyltransferase 1